MKRTFIQQLLLPLAGIGLMSATCLPAAEEGFVFTEEEVAAADEAAAKLQALISNGAEYSRACTQAYSDIHLIVGNCYRAIGKTVDYTECADQKTVADIHREAASRLISKYAVDPASGTIMDGVMCRSNLLKAKPNLTAKAYETIDQNIDQLEAMLKWFMGPFAKTCAYYNSDFYQELQKAARFKELTQSSEYRRMEQNYQELFRDLARGTAHERINKARINFRRYPETFFARFGDDISRQELENWYNEVVLDAEGGKPYRYLRVRDEAIIWAPTAQGAELANYESRFDYWTEERINAVVETGKNAINLSLDNGSELNNYQTVAAQYPYSLLSQTLSAYNDKTKKQLFAMANELYTFRDFLEGNTLYLNAMLDRDGKTLLYWANRKLDMAKKEWKAIREQAQVDKQSR